MVIQQVRAATPEIIDALERLIPQLTTSNPPPGAEDLVALLANASNVLLVVRHPGESDPIVAAGSLAVYRVPTGVRAIIEDVVVDESARGLGIGEALMRQLLEEAHRRGAPGVSLTSNPRRTAANRLYVRLGFALRQTNCYYLRFASGTALGPG